MPSLLLELFSEEIPARMQADAAQHLAVAVGSALETAKLIDESRSVSVDRYVSPRRLAILVRDIAEMQPDISEEIKGPKTNAPEAALAGFLKKTGLNKNQLEEREGVYFATIERKGRATPGVLKPLIEEILVKFPWPKSMRWGSRDEVWVRPLHSIVCLLDSNIIPIEFAGVKAGNTTYGHRFLAPQPITLKDASEYEKKLEAALVIADRERRKANIKVQLEAKAASNGLTWKEDNALLEEVVGLVEWPVVMLGEVDKQFMHLPPELLTTVMRSHQKYFTLNDKSGKFASTFAFVANRDTQTGGKEIIAGNERVLRARFSDAKFFFEQDQKKPLSEWNKGLEKVIFHAKIGTVAKKVERIKELCASLREAIALRQSTPPTDPHTPNGTRDDVLMQAAFICKADLVTGMVSEFPELQGIIGSYYAKAESMSDEACEALYHLYNLPKDLKNLRPTAQILCMADRLDTLISLFAIGEKPTGSKDPYALRRAALGVIAIIRNHGIRLDLHKLLCYSRAGGNPVKEKLDPRFRGDDTALQLLEFFNDRLEADLLEQGIERTTLRAIGGLAQDADIVRVEARAKALQTFLKTAESEALLAAYRRAANILEIEQKKDKKQYEAGAVSIELLKDPAEKSLHQVLGTLSSDIGPLMKQEDFTAVMQQLATLKAPLDTFFDKIMVNIDDTKLRANRLSLLAAIVSTMNQVADFREIIG